MVLRNFVLKIHSRCNLACDHCYMYEAVDQTWRDRPRIMSDRTVAAVGAKIARYAARHHLDVVRVIMHGGEPLLIGPTRFAKVVKQLRAAIEPMTRVEMGVQTNGVRITQEWADLLLELGVLTGISLDGGQEANDQHRLYQDGASSYAQTVRGIQILNQERYRPVFGGLLCTVDVRNDPVKVFEDLRALQPPMIDVLLPHATHEFPPPNRTAGRAVYGEWLAAIFDAWFDAPPTVGIRFFEELANALLGGLSRSEAIGLGRSSTLVIETDGMLEQTDALKVAYPGAAGTGLNVHTDDIDKVLNNGLLTNSSLLQDLSPTCQKCPVVRVCGGGMFPHRYRPGSGFGNPSVYCADLEHVIRHIDRRISSATDRMPTILATAAAQL